MTTIKPIDEFRRILREGLDVHSVFAWTKYLKHGLDAHFDARTADLNMYEYPANASDYWRQPATGPNIPLIDGEFKCPANLLGVAVYSKNAFTVALFRTKLPTLTKDDQAVWMGFENDSNIGTGIAGFRFYRSAGVEHFAAYAGANFTLSAVPVTGALPADAKTAFHVYSVHLLNSWAEFYIDTALVCVMLNSPNLAFPTVGYPPYGIGNTPAPFSRPMLVLIEVWGNGEELIHPLSPYNTRLSNVPEKPPRVIRLYQTGTKNLLAGLSLSAGSVTSHPVPVLGYSGKTLFFKANQAGTLLIEVLMQTGNWLTYDSVSVSPDVLASYIMNGEAVLVRVTYTPTTYPAVISEAEVVMA